jgi:hypothetical protein
MTIKEKMLTVIQSLDDDASIDQAIDRLYLLRKIEIGLQQADAKEVLDSDDFFKQLEDEED